MRSFKKLLQNEKFKTFLKYGLAIGAAYAAGDIAKADMVGALLGGLVGMF